MACVYTIQGKTYSEREFKELLFSKADKMTLSDIVKGFGGKKSEEGKKKTLVTQRTYEGEFRKEVKRELEKIGLYRKEVSFEEAKAMAKEAIRLHGIDTALEMVRAGDIVGGAAARIYAAKMLDLDARMSEAENPIALMSLAKEYADITEEAGLVQTKGGQFNAQWAEIYEETGLGFNLEKAIDDWKAQNNGFIPAEVEAKFRENDRKIKELSSKIAQLQEEADKKQAQESVENIQESVEREKKKGSNEKRIKEASKKLADKFRKAKLSRPDIFSSASPASLVWDAAMETVATTIEAMGSVAQAVADGMKIIKESDWYKNLDAKTKAEAEKSFSEVVEQQQDLTRGIKIPHAMIRDFVERGINNIEDLTKAVQEAIKEEYPDATEREVRDAITNYGKTINPNPEKIEADIRKMKRLGKLISQLEDIQAQKRPLRSGQQRDKVEADERAKMKEVREAMKDLPIDATLEAEQLKTAHDAIKQRIANAIDDLQKQLDENYFPEYEKKKTEYDAKEKEALAKLQELKDKVLDAKEKQGLIPSKELPKSKQPAEITRLEKQIEDLQKQLERGAQEFKETTKKEKTAIEKLLAEQVQELKDIHDAVFGSGLTDAEKAQKSIEATEKALERVKKKIEENDLEFKKQNKPNDPFKQSVKDRLKRANELLTTLRDEAGITEKRRLEQNKKSAQRRIEELQRRINEGDFSKKERKPLIADTELTRLRAEKLKLQEEYQKELHKDKLKNRTQGEIVKDALWDAWGLTRALRATLDLSFMLVQGGIQTMAHPVNAAEAFKNSLKFFASPEKTQAFLDNIKGQSWYPELKASKLAITEPHAQLTAREELFYSDHFNMIWNLLGRPLKLINDNAFETWKNLSPLAAFERASVGYLDTLRVLRFLQGKQMLEAKGITFQENPKAYKEMADVINTLTGRASLGALEQISEPLSKLFFSPRNWASVMKQTFLLPRQLVKWNKTGENGMSTANKMALRDLSSMVGITLGFVMLAALKLNNDDDDETGVEFDPRSSDFMKIKIGRKRIDPWGGRIQQIVFSSRMLAEAVHYFKPELSGGGFKTSGGEVVAMGTPYKAPQAQDLMINMAINKLSPSAGMMQNFLSKMPQDDGTYTDEYGNTYTLSQDMKDNMYPMILSTAGELLKDDPSALDGLLLGYSVLGGSVNTYEAKDKKSVIKSQLEKEDLKGLAKEKQDIINEFLVENKAEIDKMSEEKFKKVFSHVKTVATKYAKEEITIKPDFKEYLKEVKEDKKEVLTTKEAELKSKDNDIKVAILRAKLEKGEMTKKDISNLWDKGVISDDVYDEILSAKK